MLGVKRPCLSSPLQLPVLRGKKVCLLWCLRSCVPLGSEHTPYLGRLWLAAPWFHGTGVGGVSPLPQFALPRGSYQASARLSLLRSACGAILCKDRKSLFGWYVLFLAYDVGVFPSGHDSLRSSRHRTSFPGCTPSTQGVASSSLLGLTG